jgi:hypothetical protein
LGPRGSDTIPISSGLFQGILPRIPNLELGYIYSFGSDVRVGRGTVDYLLPINLGNDSTIFGEGHAEFQDFWKTPPGGTNNRVDLSFGGGYRTIIRNSTLLGLNGFYDTSRLFGSWYSSGGLGLEMAAITSGDGAIDLNLNWYGNLFTRDGLINAFRNKGGCYDIEAGYSHPLFNQALDLRLKLTGYQFDIGNNVYGWRTGADVTTRDGVFTVRYEYGQDSVNGSYNSIGGFVNVGFQPENILRGENPFISPEPVFQSPRNLRRMLTQKVRRDWHQPASVVGAKSAPAGSSSGPWFRFTLSNPQPGTVIRSTSWTENETYIYVTPGGGCPIVFRTDTFTIQIEGYESHGPTSVRMRVTSDAIAPGGCRNVALVTPGGEISADGAGGTGPGPVTFTIPAGGALTSGPSAGHYAIPGCQCNNPITPNAEAGTLLLEDVAGIAPPQTIHTITVP